MKIKFLSITIGLISLALTACETTPTNINVNANVNRNTAIVVPDNTNVSSSNRDRWDPKISKEEYEKDRAKYEKEKGSDSWGQSLEDSWLWFKTRSALATTDDLRESTIDVDVTNGVITLKGTVASEAEKKKAYDVANGIEDKKSVKNELKVAPKDSATNQMVNGNEKSNTNKSNTNK